MTYEEGEWALRIIAILMFVALALYMWVTGRD